MRDIGCAVFLPGAMGRSGLSCLSLDVWSGNLSGLTEAFSDVTLLVGWAFGFACAAFLSAELEGQITHFVTSAFAVIEATVDAVFFFCQNYKTIIAIL